MVYGIVNDVESLSNLHIDDIVDDSLAINELSPATEYFFWVRHLCGSETSEWRSGGSFTTQISCASVVDVDPTTISANGIALTWDFDHTVGATATQTEVAWKEASSDASFNTIVTDDLYYIISGLQPNTAYEVRLRTICDSDTADAFTQTITTKLNGVVISTRQSESDVVPTDCYRDYSFAQMIYPSSDLDGINTISEIAFLLSSNIAINRTWDIYMGHTARTSISATSYVPMDSLTLVGSAVPINISSGWCRALLTTPFSYDSDSNLVIVIDDNSGTYRRDIKFYTHSGSSVYFRRDREDILPTNLPTLTALAYVPDIAFPQPLTLDECKSPIVALGDITDNSVELIWNVGNPNESYQVEYRLSSDEAWTTALTSVSDTFYTVSNLMAGSFYQFRVGTLCGDVVKYCEPILGFTDCDVVDLPYHEDFMYIADYIEPSRDFPGVDRLREVCDEDLDRGVLLGLEMTIEEMTELGNPVHPATLAARDALKGQN